MDLAHCNGCGRCVEDCPYEAVRLVGRTDERPFLQQAQVSSALCVELRHLRRRLPVIDAVPAHAGADDRHRSTGLPPARAARAGRKSTAAGLAGTPRVLIFACRHGAGAGRSRDTVELPCVGMMPPSLIDYVLSRNLADGVVVAGCAERSGYHRLGVAWTKERIRRCARPLSARQSAARAACHHLGLPDGAAPLLPRAGSLHRRRCRSTAVSHSSRSIIGRGNDRCRGDEATGGDGAVIT